MVYIFVLACTLPIKNSLRDLFFEFISHFKFHHYNSKKTNNYDRKLYWLLVFYILLIVIYFLYIPLLENDPQEYFHLAKLILMRKSLDFYPILNGSETRGFIAPWTHPIGYPIFLAWNMLSLPYALGCLLAKLSSLYFSIIMLVSLYLISVKENLQLKHLAGILFLSTPICFYESYICHIDSIRMVLFLATIITLYLHSLTLNYRSALLVGVTTGLSWFVHSSGLLTLIIALGINLLSTLRKPKKTFIYSGIIIVSSTLLVTFDLINIYAKLGKFIGDFDNIKIIRLLNEDFKIFVGLNRGIHNMKEAFTWGLGKVFFQYNTYGASYIFFIIGAIILLLKHKNVLKYVDFFKFNTRLTLTQHLGLTCLLFWGGVILSVFLGLTIFTVNPRYLLQIQPIICFIGASGISTFLFKMKKNTLYVFSLLCILLYFYPIYTYLHPFKKLENFDFTLSDEKKFSKFIDSPALETIKLINNVRDEGKILTLRQAEFLTYSNKEIIHAYDERTVAIAKATSTKEVLDILNNLKIHYIMSYHYNDPVYYATPLRYILENSNLTELIYYKAGIFLYKLRDLKQAPLPLSDFFPKTHLLEFQPISHNKNFTFWVSHVDAHLYPYLSPTKCLKKPLENLEGYYTNKLTVEIDSLKETKLSLNIVYFKESFYSDFNFFKLPTSIIQEFYLKKGKNRIVARFNNNEGPFRLILKANEQASFKVEQASLEQTYLSPPFKIKANNESAPLFIKNRYILSKNDELFETQTGEFLNANIFINSGKKLSLEVEGEGLFCIEYDNLGFWSTLPFLKKSFCFGLSSGYKSIAITYKNPSYLKFILQPANETVQRCWVKMRNVILHD
ncbi:MAG: hypothetical protein BGO76_01850 [Caedibacter sp. 38-128]|nr:MAG: hypothetical protein BGO76_01850 [Caedibacter sp. 38-128]